MSEYEIKTLVEEFGAGSYTRHYYVNDNLDVVFHKDDGPAVIIVRPGEGQVEEIWYQHGKKHRVDGPAVVETVEHEDGRKKVNEYFFLRGRPRFDIEHVLHAKGITEEDWKKAAAAYLELEKKSTRGL